MSWMLLLLLAALPSASPAAEDDLSSSFDEPLTAFAPRTPPSETQQRRIDSAALYAQSRREYKREEFGKALRHAQRAWRYRPQVLELLPEIISLANELRRTDETVRYVLLAGGRIEIDPLLVKRLALRLSSQQQWQPALQLYELALRQRPPLTEEARLEVGDALLYFDMGRISFLLADYGKAAEYFARVHRVLEDPQQLSDNASLQKMLVGQADRTYQLLAESYLAVGQDDRAAEMFRKAREADKNDALLDYHLARIDVKQGRDELALERLERYLQAESGRAERAAWELLADVLARLRGAGGEQELYVRLEPLAAADSASTILLQFLGDRQKTARRWDEAQRWYARIVDDQPTADALAGLADMQRQQQRWDQLLNTLGQAAAAGFMLEDLGETGRQTAADKTLVDTLLAEAQRRLETDREGTAGSGVPLAAADLAIADGRYEAAEPLLELVLQWNEPDVRSRALLSWGVDLLLGRQFAQAATLLRRGVDEQLLSARADVGHYYLVRALALADQQDEALRRAEAAADLFPDSLRLQSLPAWVLYRAKRYDEAVQRYRAVLKSFDDIHDNPAVRQEMRDIRLSLSNVAVQQGRLDQATEWLEQVLDEFPEDVGALNDLGYLWTEQGRYLNWSLQMIQKAVDEEPDNVAYLDSLGWVYYHLQRHGEAVEWLEKAAAGEAPDGVILDHLGDAYWKANQPEQALQTWQRAAEQFEKDGDAAKRDATLNKISDNHHGNRTK